MYDENSTFMYSTSSTTTTITFTSKITTNSNSRNNIYKESQPNVSSICPGMEYFTNQISPEIVFHDNVTDCDNITLGFTSGQGVVFGRCQDSRTFCHMHIQVARGKVVKADIMGPRDRFQCKIPRSIVHVYDNLPSSIMLDSTTADYYFACTIWLHTPTDPYEMSLLSTTNHMYVLQYNEPLDRIKFQKSEKDHLFVNYTSSHSGYVKCVIPAGIILSYVNHRRDIGVPVGHVVTVTVKKVASVGDCQAYVQVYHKDQQKLPSMLISVCYEQDIPVTVFNTTRIHINLDIPVGITVTASFAFVLFTYSMKNESSPKVVTSLLNCNKTFASNSAHSNYCENNALCPKGLNEQEHCPANIEGCVKWMKSFHKCLQISAWNNYISRMKAQTQCQRSGGNLASFKTYDEWRDAQSILKYFNRHDAKIIIGLTCGWHSVPLMYSRFCRWSDNTMLYFIDKRFPTTFPVIRTIRHYQIEIPYTREKCPVVSETIRHDRNVHYACEFSQIKTLNLPEPVAFPTFERTTSLPEERHQKLHVCPGGHLTQTFLLCDLKSHCGQMRSTSYCVTWNASILFIQKHPPNAPAHKVAMFACDDDDVTSVPYTLLCDFRQDCPDNSDESFCVHPPCDGFQCTNGQCVLISKRCNFHSYCLDDSDEHNCGYIFRNYDRIFTKASLLINHGGWGYFSYQIMKVNATCPDTHYRCTSELLYCLPVYTRCNGFNDCIKHEDEQDCDRATCPGFYQCRDSIVCVHVDHLCDGWGQCPQRDDEWLCDMTCPVGCLCQGLSFACIQPFSADMFHHIRYLDATGSGMTPSDLNNNTYLVHLSLSHCSLVSMSDISYPNLLFLDLSNNMLTNIKLNIFLRLQNLRVLLLASNPLLSLTKESSNLTQTALRKVDLSQTYLSMFDSHSLMYFPQVKSLNISFSAIQVIGPWGFKKTPQVTKLDLRGNVVTKLPSDVFLGLNVLSTILTSDYRICCRKRTSKISNSVTCTAPQSVLSSCEHMLKSDLHRHLLWCVSVLALCGNCLCFIRQCTGNIHFKSSFIICMINMQCANLCIGICTSTFVVANEMFQGKYFLQEKSWRNSVACKMAGFVSLLSGEVFIFILWLMTLDHVIALCLPSHALKLNKRSAAVVCGVMWLFALLVTSISLLQDYGQTALCSVVLFDKHYAKQESYMLLFVMIFNFVLCLMIGVGQLIICRSASTYRISANSTQKSVFSSQYLVVKVGVTTVVCQSSIAITNLMNTTGVPVSGTLSAIMAVCLFPLSSALYPVLYWWSEVNNQRQREIEERLLQALKAQHLQ